MNYDIPIAGYLRSLEIGTLGLQLYYLLSQSRNNNRIMVFLKTMRGSWFPLDNYKLASGLELKKIIMQQLYIPYSFANQFSVRLFRLLCRSEC